jgi:hypothetical protein
MTWEETTRGSALAWVLGIASLLHVLMVVSEVTFPHPTAHARLAMDEMLQGVFRPYFWAGVGFVGVGLLAPWLGGLAAVFALLGLLAHEHAYVQAGQSVPLA